MCSHVNRITFYGGDSVECFDRTEGGTPSHQKNYNYSVECVDRTDGRILPHQINQRMNIIRRLRRNTLSDAADNQYDHD